MKKIYFLLSILILCSCSSTNGLSDPPVPENPRYSYLALGDSYTIGESVAEEDRWPVQLAEFLREQGYKMAAPKIIAKTGWTTENLLRGMENDLEIHRDFDLVSILIGVNNQYQNKPVGEYEEQLRQIFRRAINHSKTMEKGVFAVSIPDYGYTPFGAENQEEISAKLEVFNDIFRRVAEDYNVDFYNITPISQTASENPGLVASDGLHPSGEMYRLWVQEIAYKVAEKLPE